MSEEQKNPRMTLMRSPPSPPRRSPTAAATARTASAASSSARCSAPSRSRPSATACTGRSILRNTESTDDAYVNGNVIQITSQVAGTVVRIAADDTEFVKAGTMLVQLDTADAKVALDAAESQLAKTVRQVRNLYATSGKLSATVHQRESDLARAQDDLRRRERLVSTGAVSGEELQHAKDAFTGAEAAANAARRTWPRSRRSSITPPSASTPT